MNKIAFALLALTFGTAFVLATPANAQMSDGELRNELSRAAVRVDDCVGNFSPGEEIFMRHWQNATAARKNLGASLQSVEYNCDGMARQAKAYRLDIEKLLGADWREKFTRGHKRAESRAAGPVTDAGGRLYPNGVVFQAYKMGLR